MDSRHAVASTFSHRRASHTSDGFLTECPIHGEMTAGLDENGHQLRASMSPVWVRNEPSIGYLANCCYNNLSAIRKKKMSAVFLFKETYNLSAVTSDQRSVLPIKLQTIVEQVAGYCCIGDRRRTGFLARMRVDRGRRNRAKPFGRVFGCDARPGASWQGKQESSIISVCICVSSW